MQNANTIKNVPKIYVVTAHGRQEVPARADERLMDILKRNGIPWSGISMYAKPLSGATASAPKTGLDWKLIDFKDTQEILLYFNRNINPFLFSLDNAKIVEGDGSDPLSTEYIYQAIDNASSTCHSYLKKLTPVECREVIAERIGDMIRANVPSGSKIVVGVSGGGDSNAMLHGLGQLKDHDISVHPIIVKGIPDWDAGVPRAQQLCENYGLPLDIIEEPDARSLLGITSKAPLIDCFEAVFKGDDFEFLGTLLIRLALMRRAKELGTEYICTGVNLEDSLCENLFRTANGLAPAAYPVRVIGSHKLLFPLWLCPKRIIDGCFPKYSLENYEARYPCFSIGRNLYYSVVFGLQSQFPGFPEHLVRGFSERSTAAPVNYVYDEELGFHVERFVPFALRNKFKQMLGRA